MIEVVNAWSKCSHNGGMAFYIVSIWLQCLVSVSALNVSALKLKNSDFGISTLIIRVKFYHKINNVAQFT